MVDETIAFVKEVEEQEKRLNEFTELNDFADWKANNIGGWQVYLTRCYEGDTYKDAVDAALAAASPVPEGEARVTLSIDPDGLAHKPYMAIACEEDADGLCRREHLSGPPAAARVPSPEAAAPVSDAKECAARGADEGYIAQRNREYSEMNAAARRAKAAARGADEGEREVYEVERDRFGVQYSGPLEVGECVRVVPVEKFNEQAAAASPVPRGVHHKDGPIAQIRQAADWLEGEAEGPGPNDCETLGKIAADLRAASDALAAAPVSLPDERKD